MAGVLLLQKKSSQPLTSFNDKIDRIKHFTKEKFNSQFRSILFKQPNQNTFLILFQKDTQEKYFQDEKGNWIAFEGVVYALNETRKFNVRDLLDFYKSNKDDFPNLLDGHFVIKLYDLEKNQILILNDFIKNKTNFWLETKNEFMFTPFLIYASAIQKPELDPYAFNEYMWRYYIMSNRSMLKNVHRLESAMLFKISQDQISSTRYWEFPHDYSDLSFKQSLDKLLESFKESARLVNQDSRKPLVEFTMGQDSRTVLSAFTNQKIPFLTAIYGKDDFHEVTGVKEMAKKYNFETKHIQLTDNFLNNPWQEVKDSILLGSADEPAYLMGRILHMRKQYLNICEGLAVNGVHGRFYKDGIWNEMYMMNFYREPRSFNSEIFIKYRALNKNYRDDIFNEDFKKIKNDSAGYMRKLIGDSIAGYENSPVAMQVDKFDLEHYSIFGTVGSNICNMVIDLISPLLFRRNLELALTLPANWKYNLSRIQRGIVNGLNPKLAAEKTDFSGVNMKPKNALTIVPFLVRYYYGQSKKFRDKLKSLMGFHVKTQLQKAWDYQSIYQKFYFDDEVQSYLNYKEMALTEIIKEEEWNQLKEKYKNPEYQTVDNLEYILKIFTVEYFLRNCNID